MLDPLAILSISFVALAAVIVTTSAALKGWRGWLDLRRLELQERRGDAAMPATGARIELADLRERVRKLEAIAAGVDF